MLTTGQYLRYCDDALDQYAAVCRELGDDLVSVPVPGLAGSNSAFALVSHVVGVMGFWGRTTNRDIEVPRDRPAEFRATGTVEEALGLLRSGRERLHEDVDATTPDAAPARPARDGSPIPYETQGDVLLHVYEELAQHLGQLEVTRDVLLARADRGATTSG